MGRPKLKALNSGGTTKPLSVNTALPIGQSGLSGNLIIMRGFVDGASAPLQQTHPKGNKILAQLQAEHKH